MLSPRSARRPDAFYGWHMLLFCTIVRGFTAPGQTIGVSAFTDDLIESLGTSRSAVATAYMVGTLTGAVALPFVGRFRRLALLLGGVARRARAAGATAARSALFVFGVCGCGVF